MLIYLIDDDLDDQEFFALAVEEVGDSFELITSNNGVDALEELSNPDIAPDVIFLDLNMPRLDGWECVTRLKAISHLRNSPIVIYSTSEPSPPALKDKTFDFFLTKQPRISELVGKLRDILSQIQAGTYVGTNK